MEIRVRVANLLRNPKQLDPFVNSAHQQRFHSFDLIQLLMHKHCLQRLVSWVDELAGFHKIHHEVVVDRRMASNHDTFCILFPNHLVTPKLLIYGFLAYGEISPQTIVAHHLPNTLDVIKNEQRLVSHS